VALAEYAKLWQRSMPVSQEGRITMPIEQKVTLDEVVEVMGGEVRKAVDKYFDFLQKTVSSYPLGDTELGGKAKDCAEKNITMARDYMHKLSRAKDLLEAVPIHTEFMQSQLAFMGEQIKSLGEIYIKAATEVLNAPLPTNDVLELPSIIPPSVQKRRSS
jgi:phasin protein